MSQFRRIRDFARELLGKPEVREDGIRAAAQRAFGKKRRADYADAARDILRTHTPYPAPKSDLSPRLSVPTMTEAETPERQPTASLNLPTLPKPTVIPDKMWVVGALGAILSPRHAGLFLQSPVLWKQRQDTQSQQEWQKQVDLLLKQLDLGLKARQIDADTKRAEAYAKSVEDLASVRESQVDLNRARAMKAMADVFQNQYKLTREQAETLSNLYLRAGDPRASQEERRILLKLAEDYGRQLNPELFPQTIQSLFPSLELPEGQGIQETIDLETGEVVQSNQPMERAVGLSPAQERALADAEASRALAELQEERKTTEQQTREKRLAMLDAELLVKTKTLEKLDADIKATRERLALARQALALRREELNERKRATEVRELLGYRRHWQQQSQQIIGAINAITNNPEEWQTITTTDPQGNRITQRVPRFSAAQEARLNELRARLQEIEGTLTDLDDTIDQLLGP